MHRHAASDRPALLIDGMGTLVSLAPPAPRLARVLSRRFGVAISEAQARRGLDAEIGFYRAHMEEGRDAESLRALRHRCAEVLRSALPASEGLARADGEALTAALLEALRFEPFHDSRDALLAARAHGARVVVVSNWDVSLAEVLERIGLAPLLDGVVTSAAIDARKPGPAIFRHALAVAGVTADRARHVGDNLQEDVVGARGCGIAAVLLRRVGGRGGDGDDDHDDGVPTIASLSELTWP